MHIIIFFSFILTFFFSYIINKIGIIYQIQIYNEVGYRIVKIEMESEASVYAKIINLNKYIVTFNIYILHVLQEQVIVQNNLFSNFLIYSQNYI